MIEAKQYRILTVLAAATVAALLAALLAARPSGAQQPQERADAGCPGGSGGIASDTGRRFAQTFTAENSGKLTRAQFELSANTFGADFTLEIRAVDDSGAPTDAVLASAVVEGVPDADGHVTPITGDFSSAPATVVAGERYAFSVTVDPNSSYNAHFRTNDPCPGELFGDPSANGTFVPVQGMDLVFATFVETQVSKGGGKDCSGVDKRPHKTKCHKRR